MRAVQRREDRKDGWTEEKKSRFIEELEATCNIAAALRAVEMGRTGLARLRARDGAFRARMLDARRRAYLDLEFFALEKMMAGTVKTVTKADGSVETVHEYPLTQALHLLRLHRVAAPGGEPEEAAGEPDEARRVEVVERLMRKMGKLRERMDREEAAAAQAGGGEGSNDEAEAGR
jgi:predicted metal-dependent enzyme (double-stranded beta helix superfamily)